jgi:hypothetical protein
MIDAKRETIRELLNESISYVVPKNQREFEWKRDQAEEFWEDMCSGGSFLGTIVLNIEEKNKNKKVYIVDGQQRITTIFILLAACKNQALKQNAISQAQAIREKLSFIDDTTGESKQTKLIASPSIKEAFEATITNDKWDGKSFYVKNKRKQINKIKPIYEYFSEKIKNYKQEEIKEILEHLYQSIIIKIEIEDTQEAFEIFERTNARGMELNAADLLKNYLFSKEISSDLEERWELVMENSLGNIVRMIKYFYVSKLGYVQKKKLFGELRKYGEKIGPEKLLQELENFSYLHQLVGDSTTSSIMEWANQNKIDYFAKEYYADELNRSLDAINLFRISQVYPIIIKTLTFLVDINDHEKKEKLTKKFLDFIKVIEKYHFINNAVSQRPGNEVEKYYTEKCSKKINSKEELVNFFDEVTSDLKRKLVLREEFIGRFGEINYQNDFSLIYYIYDRLNNKERKGGQYIKIYNPDKKIIKRNYNIDHLISQDSSRYDFNFSDLSDDMLHNIGNLLVISMHTNSELGNRPIEEKFKILREKETLPEVNNFVKNWEKKEWNSLKNIQENINQRTKDLGSIAYDCIWKL